MHRIDDNESRTYLLTELTVPRARQVVATSDYLIARWASEYNAGECEHRGQRTAGGEDDGSKTRTART